MFAEIVTKRIAWNVVAAPPIVLPNGSGSDSIVYPN
jgi:hypothetical protein